MTFDWKTQISNLGKITSEMWPFDGKYKNIYLGTAVLFYSLTALPGIKCLLQDSSEDGFYHQFCQCLALYILVNLCLFRLRLSKQKDILKFMRNDRRRSKYQDLEEDMISFRILSRFLMIITMILHILIFVIVAAFPWIWSRIKGESPILIIDVWYPLFNKNSPAFEIIFIIQYTQGLFATLFSYKLTSFFIIVTCHGCGQLKILCRKIQRFPGNHKHRIRVQKNVDLNCSCIKCIVVIHLKVIRFFKSTNEWFELFAIVCMICTVALYGQGTLSVIKQLQAESVGIGICNIGFLLLPLSLLILYNWLGDLVSEESENIIRTLDNVNWQQLSRSEIKSLSIIRSYSCSKPIQLTIGNYLVLSRPFLMQICLWILTYLAYCFKIGMKEEAS